MRAKKTVDGNRGVGNEGERETMGAFTGKKEKKGKGEEAQMGWHEGEWRQCGGRRAERRKKWRGKERETASTATLLFMLYSIVNGATLSVIFMVYTLTSLTCSTCC